MRNDLPTGWKLEPLGEVCYINPRRSSLEGYCDDTEVTFIPMSAVDGETGAITAPRIERLGKVKKGYTFFIEGDVLFAKITPCMQNGKSAIARNLRNGLGFGSTEFHVLRPKEGAMSEWIHFFVRQKWFRDLAASHFTGTVGQQRVPVSFVEEQEIPLPPLEEQRRIVARGEELMDRMQEAKALRCAAREETGAIMPAALVEVFAGAEEKGWESRQLGKLVTIVAKQIDPKLPEYKDLPHINGERIESGTCRLLPYCSAAEDGMKSGKYLFKARSVLYSKIRPYLQKVTYVDFEGLCSADMYPLEVISGDLEPRFLMWSLVAPPFTEYAVQQSSRARMPKLNRTQLFSYMFSFPPVTEQKRIIRYLDALQSKVQSLRHIQEETQKEIDAMIAAILARAFRGEL